MAKTYHGCMTENADGSNIGPEAYWSCEKMSCSN